MRENTIQQLLKDAWDLRRNSDYTRAKACVDEALLLCESTDFEFLGRIYHIKMQFEADHDQLAKAVEFSKGSVAFYKKAGNNGRTAHATRHLADLQSRLGQLDNAEQNYKEALKFYRANSKSFKGDLASALRAFGLLLEKKKKIKAAIQSWKEAREIYAGFGVQEGIKEAEAKIKELTRKRR